MSVSRDYCNLLEPVHVLYLIPTSRSFWFTYYGTKSARLYDAEQHDRTRVQDISVPEGDEANAGEEEASPN